jgi:transposase
VTASVHRRSSGTVRRRLTVPRKSSWTSRRSSARGLTAREIAERLDYHPATISKWLAEGGPPPRRRPPSQPVIDERWAGRIAELLARSPGLLSTSIFEILRAEGFSGSYPSVVRHVHAIRGPRFRKEPRVSVRIETAPGEECQFDFSDVSSFTERWGLGPLVCFQAILCWSRWRVWWFTDSEDRQHTFECLLRFFEGADGVPRVARTDRMGALGSSQGKRFKVHPPAFYFAQFHGAELPAKPATLLTRARWNVPFATPRSASCANSTPSGHRRRWPNSTPGRRTGSTSGSMAASTERLGWLPPNASWSSVPCSAPCLSAATTARTERPAGCMWPFRCSSGAACATRSPNVWWASASRSANKSMPTSSRSASPSTSWPATTLPRQACTRSGTRCITTRPAQRHWRVTGHRVCTSSPTSPSPLCSLDSTSDRATTTSPRSIWPATRRRAMTRALWTTPQSEAQGVNLQPAGLHEQLKDDLGYLAVRRAAERFAVLAEQAQTDGWSHVEYLAAVIGEQVSATTNRRLVARMRYVRFSYRRTIEDFDYDFQPSVDRKLVEVPPPWRTPVSGHIKIPIGGQ